MLAYFLFNISSSAFSGVQQEDLVLITQFTITKVKSLSSNSQQRISTRSEDVEIIIGSTVI